MSTNVLGSPLAFMKILPLRRGFGGTETPSKYVVDLQKLGLVTVISFITGTTPLSVFIFQK